MGADVGQQASERYFIYRCDRHLRLCGGWADRLKGAMLSYVIANLTGRIFKAEFLNPRCDMSEYILGNVVNWSLPVSFLNETSIKSPSYFKRSFLCEYISSYFCNAPENYTV